jgi:outer membrane murein-binding lipoprotein Lpp
MAGTTLYSCVIGQQINGIAVEVEKLNTEAERLKQEIAELSGDDAPVIE